MTDRLARLTASTAWLLVIIGSAFLAWGASWVTHRMFGWESLSVTDSMVAVNTAWLALLIVRNNEDYDRLSNRISRLYRG